MAATVTAAMRGLMTAEAQVNGVWVGIIAAHFPFPAYIICPEARNRDDSRTDLKVIRVSDGKAMFVFEGKAAVATGDVNRAFASHSQQLIQYLGANKNRGNGYGVLAMGTKYAICRYDGSTLARLKLNSSRALDVENTTLVPGDLSTDAAAIDNIIAAVFNWIATNAPAH